MNKSISETGRKKSISKDEYQSILNLSRSNIRDWFLLLLIGNLGLRVGEAVRFRLQDFDLKDKIIKIPRIKITGKRITKNTISGLYTPMPLLNGIEKPLLKYLNTRLKGEKKDWLFPREDIGFLSVNQAQNIFYRYARRLGIKASIHSLRHMKGFLIYKDTGDIRAVQVILRHSSMNTSAKYAEPTMEVLKDLLDIGGVIDSNGQEEVNRREEPKMLDWIRSKEGHQLKKGYLIREDLKRLRKRKGIDKYN